MGLTLKYDIQCFLGLNSIVTRQSDVTSCFVFGPEVHGKKKKKKRVVSLGSSPAAHHKIHLSLFLWSTLLKMVKRTQFTRNKSILAPTC